LIADDVHGVDNTRNPTQDGQTDVDEEVSTASSLKEDSKRGEDEGEDKLADVAIPETLVKELSRLKEAIREELTRQ
jgi:phosphoribosylaminoimidazole-succinocarboxamide synthase